jgi:hypothetical protein
MVVGGCGMVVVGGCGVWWSRGNTEEVSRADNIVCCCFSNLDFSTHHLPIIFEPGSLNPCSHLPLGLLGSVSSIFPYHWPLLVSKILEPMDALVQPTKCFSFVPCRRLFSFPHIGPFAFDPVTIDRP